jgi:protein-S-isoprenylcysteine O-methyltransferase Ste14
MNSIELKLPPPAVALAVALLMWLASRVAAPIESAFALRVNAAIALALVGFAIDIAGLIAFRRARTTINPTRPMAASSLVSNGIYRFTRNPMYLGLLVELLAWAVFLSSVAALLLVPLFVLYINRFQITPEERALTKIFGAEYAAYKGRVRRWI